MDRCVLCGKAAAEKHHIIKRSQAKYLINCKLNIAPLCMSCHSAAHTNKNIDNKLRTMYYSKINRLLSKSRYTENEISEILDIKKSDVQKMLKTLTPVAFEYKKEEVLIAAMGFKLNVEVKEI